MMNEGDEVGIEELLSEKSQRAVVVDKNFA